MANDDNPMRQEVVPHGPYNPQAYAQYPQYPQGGYAPQQRQQPPFQQGFAPPPQGQPGGYGVYPQYQQFRDDGVHPQVYGQPVTEGYPTDHASLEVHDGPAAGPRRIGEADWEIPDEKRLTEDVDIKIRHGFVQKVYGILACQLLVTFGLCTWFNFHRAAAVWLYQNPWVMIVAAILMCGSVCAMACVPKAARTSPTNYILLGVLSLAMGAILGYSTGAVDTPAFLLAVGSTCAVVIAVSLFACQTRWDFTGMGPFLLVGLLCLIIFGLVAGFVRNRVTHIVYGSLGALLFSIYLVVDTQKIVGGKHRQYQFSIDDYAFAALALYLDIINIFMYILTIISASQN